MKRFLWNTLIGGIFVVVPVSLVVVQLEHLRKVLGRALAPIAHHLPFATDVAGLWAIIFLILFCFLAGLLVRTELGKWMTSSIDRRLANIIPLWGVIRGAQNVLTGEGEGQIKPALLKTDDGYNPAFVIEEIAGGRCTVFLPEAPNPMAGPVMIVDRDRVQLLDTGVARLARCVSHWGVGAGELMQHAPASMHREDG